MLHAQIFKVFFRSRICTHEYYTISFYIHMLILDGSYQCLEGVIFENIKRIQEIL